MHVTRLDPYLFSDWISHKLKLFLARSAEHDLRSVKACGKDLLYSISKQMLHLCNDLHSGCRNL